MKPGYTFYLTPNDLKGDTATLPGDTATFSYFNLTPFSMFKKVEFCFP